MLHKLAAGIFDDAPLESGPPELERVFAANGLLAAHNPNYVVRDSQLQLARSTYRALTEKRHLMVEAPCGVGKCALGSMRVTLDSGEVARLDDVVQRGIGRIVTLNDQLKLELQDASDFIRSGRQRVYTVRTQTGRTFTGTYTHPLLTFDGWTPLGDLVIGSDRIAVPRIIPVQGAKTMPAHEVELAAFLAADGGCSQPDQLSYTKTDPGTLAAFAGAAQQLPNTQVRALTSGQGRRIGWRVTRTHADLADHHRNRGIVLSEQLGLQGHTAHTKTIPACIFTLTNEQVALFLGRLWSGDGCVHASGAPQLSYSTASINLMNSVIHLLLRFGIFGRMRTKHPTYHKQRGTSGVIYELSIADAPQIRRFAESIGPHLVGVKARRLPKLLARLTDAPNPNYDLIPTNVAQRIQVALDATGRAWNSVAKTISVPEPLDLREFSRDTLAAVAAQLNNPELADIATSDILWDRVVSITDAGEDETYDLTVPGTHNFVCNDIIVHNSIGYAVPAILTRDSRKYMTTDAQGRAQARFAPVVIVTANIALQEQLTKKDLPFLKEALGVSFDFKLLKGRQNYLCRTMYEYSNATQERDTGSEREMLARLEAWAATTTTGDRNELDFEPPPALWRRFSMSNDECPGKLCPLFNECHGFNAQIAAQNADIIVTNYHTLFIDIHLRLTAGIGILNELSPVILDEAHEAPDIARDVMGGNVTTGLLLAAFSACHKAKLCGRGQHDAEVFAFFAALDKHTRADYKHRLLLKSLTNAAQLRHAYHKLAEVAEQTLEFSASSLSATERSTLYTAQKRVLNAARLLQIVDELPDTYVVSLDRNDTGGGTHGLTANIKVVEPSRMLERTLYKRPSVICTSATLTAQGSFELIRTELGAPRDLTDYADLPTPFNFEKQAMLIIPAGIPPDPNSDEFRTAMGQALCETVNYARGRTLGLFTSYRNLRIAGDALRAAGCPYRILQQGDAPRSTLTKEFRDDVQSVLLGTASFWTGVDVPGEALSCLFIDKLPFPAFGDPVLEALGDKYDDAFTRFSLPRTVMTLRQGIGRLIRANTDKGVMVILDQRLRTKNYGHSFIQSMPKMRASTNLADIRTFLNGDTPDVPWGVSRRNKDTDDDAIPF